MLRRRTVVIGLLAAVAAVVAATAYGVVARSDGATVRVYSGRHYGLERAFERFAAETGISVEFLFGSDAELRERIEAEGPDTQADVYMTVDAGNLYLGAKEGVFRPARSPVLERAVPASLRDPSGLWYGLSVRARTIVYSPERVDPAALSTYEALADPRWKGRLCMRNADNVYTQSLVASLIAHHGYERALAIVRGWVENDVEILPSDVLVLDTIAEGGCDVGIANHYYLARLLEEEGEDYPVKVVWANQDGRGTHVNVSGAGVTRYADDPRLALRLIEWLATDGQRVFVDDNHEYPVAESVEPEPLLVRAFGARFRRDRLNAAEFGALNADAVRLMDEAGYGS